MKQIEIDELRNILRDAEEAFEKEGFTEIEKRSAKDRVLRSKTYRGIGYIVRDGKPRAVEVRNL